MTLRTLAFAALMATATSAQAQCPTLADLGKGIRLDDPRGQTTAVFKRSGEYLIENRRGKSAGSTGKQTTWYVNGLTPGATNRNGYETRFVYQGNPAPKLARLGNGQTRVTSRFRVISRGREIDKGRTVFTYEGKANLKLGNCTYETLKVRTDTVLDSGSTYLWRQYYAPALDISLRSEKINASGSALGFSAYTKIRKAR